jgi:phosphatidylserine synthase
MFFIANSYIHSRVKDEHIYRHRARVLEKGTITIMTTTNFLQQARSALVPMRKASIDALLLTAFIFIGFLFLLPGILLGYPWLVLPIYALAYLLTAVLRLRQAAREIGSPRSPNNYLFH